MLNKIKLFAFKQPVLFSAILIVLCILATEISIAPLLSPSIGEQNATYLSGVILQGLTSIALIGLLHMLGLFDRVGLHFRFKRWKALWVGLPMLFYILINLLGVFIGAIRVDATRPVAIILYILLNLMIGLFEEVLCRGVCLQLMLQKWGQSKKGIYLAVLASSLLFGFAHLVNFFQQRFGLLAGVTQVVYTTFFGVFYAAIVLRNRSILPAIIFHALLDFAGNIREITVGGGIPDQAYIITLPVAINSILITLPLFIYGLIILRKVVPENPMVQEAATPASGVDHLR